ncbi:YjeF N-terminal domain-like protein [Ceraceosorus guamensis]|uniref:NAD(P)H-hydrate epimerase n=1 Tax=Ceraceosorus guamensis TaxID=1522189 RepID=A0A316W0L6_9BASI|nr:YjeF N-terminal domain-like protein [Ceraceosorus guamensis]PWN43282.1 YjeF N-terminal domain-like protein [Ceraceosorus guamensis]
MPRCSPAHWPLLQAALHRSRQCARQIVASPSHLAFSVNLSKPLCFELRRKSIRAYPQRSLRTMSIATTSAQVGGATPTGLAPSLAALAAPRAVRFISASEASEIDAALMSPDQHGYALEQLMELAGLACAQTVFRSYPPDTFPVILVAVGPGNQGGDGLVAARHLHHFGYNVLVWAPRLKGDHISRLERQLRNLDVFFAMADDSGFEDALDQADVVLDTIFGFSFKGPPREPFANVLKALIEESRMEFQMRRPCPPVVSVDIPSGWPSERGRQSERFIPEVLLSLTAPKSGIRSLVTGSKPVRHFIGGRFIPKALEHQYALALPAYPGDEQIVEVTGWEEMSLEQARHLAQQEMEALASAPSNSDEVAASTVVPAGTAAAHLSHQADAAQKLEAGAVDDQQKV